MRIASVAVMALLAWQAHAEQQAKMTFSEEFNALDWSRWQSSYSWAPDGYSVDGTTLWAATTKVPAAANPYRVSGGILHLMILRTPDNVGGIADPYIAGIISTQKSFAQTYGYFEARIRMPSTKGTMGALWLLPLSGDWPPELDITEVLANDPTTHIMTVHSKDSSARNADPPWVRVPDTSAAFHVYALDWTKDNLTWYFDGKAVATAPTPGDMHQPFYLLLDSLAGAPGSWEGTPSDRALETPDAMQVDWVRVYDRYPTGGGGAGQSYQTPPATIPDVGAEVDIPITALPSGIQRQNRASGSATRQQAPPDALTAIAQAAPTPTVPVPSGLAHSPLAASYANTVRSSQEQLQAIQEEVARTQAEMARMNAKRADDQ